MKVKNQIFDSSFMQKNQSFQQKKIQILIFLRRAIKTPENFFDQCENKNVSEKSHF